MTSCSLEFRRVDNKHRATNSQRELLFDSIYTEAGVNLPQNQRKANKSYLQKRHINSRATNVKR